MFRVSILTVLVLLLSACHKNSGLERLSFWGESMGTTYNIVVIAPKSDTSKINKIIKHHLDDIEEKMSTYLDESEISKFNDLEANSWFTFSPITFDVIQKGQEISKLTDGAFDITVQPLVNLWGFGPNNKPEKIPYPDEIDSVYAIVGYEGLELNNETFEVNKRQFREIDLSAIAKGYAVDLVADQLTLAGFDRYLVEVGGEMRFSGLKLNDDKWRVAVEKPDSNSREIYQYIEITDGGIATSGDYRNYDEIDGLRVSHTIDPASGYPVEHNLVSVTVLDKSTARADALATAFMVMGAQKAQKLAQLHNIPVLLIEKQQQGFSDWSSDAYQEQVLDKP